MAERVEIFSVACNAGVLQANAVETALTFDPGVVREIEIVIPAGHAGVTGLAIANAHQIVIPNKGSVWIIGDDEVIRWPMDGYLNSGSWSAFTYNTDFANAHTWYFRFLIDEIRDTLNATVPTPLTSAQIFDSAATQLSVSQGI